MMKKRNWIVVALCIAIVGMGIGFAALSQNLQISATANITGEWDVRIDSIQPGPSNGATGSIPATWFSDRVTSVTFEVDLEYPGAYAEYFIILGNHGNIDAFLSSVTGVTAANSTGPSEIQFSVRICDISTDPATFTNVDTIGTFLRANSPSGNRVTIRAEWVVEEGVESTIPDIKSKSATINLNYVQAT